MCGIAGIVVLSGAGGPPPRDALVRMASALEHRGPDEFGIYRDGSAGLAHARLSIVDRAAGQQPLANAAGNLWIAFNGEIYNHVELRTELEQLGHRFRSRSDTEVIVHAYEEWGDRAFTRMNGQWALAIWDELKKRLVLSRDPQGIHPLYLCRHRDRLYFASEVKAIFAAEASIPRALDPIGLDETFTFWTAVAPRTVFFGIEELQPGHVRAYQDRTFQDHAYCADGHYDALDDSGRFPGSVEDAARAVHEALEQSVRLRMLRADVPVGSYLSGGLDSSLVAAMGQRYAPGRFQTFSLRFADAEYDESAYQRQMASKLGSEHHEITVTRTDIARVFSDVVYHAERPLLRTAPAPMFLLSGLVRERGIKVVLTGEGADEMFAGYDLFREAKVRRFWARFPESKMRSRALERLYPYLSRSPVSRPGLARQFFGGGLADHANPGFAHATRWNTTATLKRLFSTSLRDVSCGHDCVAGFLEGLPAQFKRWSTLSQDQYIESRILLAGYLLSSQGDRMLMANSIEGRFPFLDGNVVALANSLPASYKLRALDEKHVLKRAARGLVPETIVSRHKQPYRSPDALSFVGEGRPAYVDEMFREENLSESGIFDAGAAAALWKKCRSRAADGQYSNIDNMALVGVLSTQLLHHHFIRNRPAGRQNIRLLTDVDHSRRPGLSPDQPWIAPPSSTIA